jgi:cyanophycin synthetase
MNYIEINEEMQRVLASQNLALDSIPAIGAKVKLRFTANIATGGTAEDVTDIIHPDNILIAETATKVIGLKACGVDFITTDITKSWKETGGAICEVNSSPGMRPHWLSNPNRDVVNPVLNTVFAPTDNGRIPAALITGSNGKTTTTRMLDHILRAAGHISGAVTTDGVSINGEYFIEGDVAGTFGAFKLLNNPTITSAVMETARGGLITKGIYLDFCDVAALLNVDFEQVGIDGINSVEEMANLKRKVVETARKKIALNAENKHCLKIAKDFPTDFVILFAIDENLEAIKNHIKSGGVAVVVKNNIITICSQRNNIEVIDINNVPAAFEGKVEHNVSNALAACALAYGMDIEIDVIAKGLSSFKPDSKNSTGRFAFVENTPVKIILDFAHNPPALKSAVKAINKFKTKGKSICLFNSPGNRPDFQIEDCANAVANNFDYYIPFERDYWRRNRKSGEITNILSKQLLKLGIKQDNIICASNEKEAIDFAAKLAKPEDLIVIFGSDAKACEMLIKESALA